MKLTEKELIELNHKVVERLKFLSSMRAHSDMMEFNIGEKVSFMSSTHEKITGILVKYNKKTVTIFTEDGRKWNVPPSLLRKEKESSDNKSDNILKINSTS